MKMHQATYVLGNCHCHHLAMVSYEMRRHNVLAEKQENAIVLRFLSDNSFFFILDTFTVVRMKNREVNNVNPKKMIHFAQKVER